MFLIACDSPKEIIVVILIKIHLVEKSFSLNEYYFHGVKMRDSGVGLYFALTNSEEVKMLMFKDRKEAGKLLSLKLHPLIEKERNNLIMLALPRGGLPVAFEVAKAESLMLDVLIVRKIGHPDNPEFGVGAIAEDGTYWINPLYQYASDESNRKIKLIMEAESLEIKRRMKLYRGNKPIQSLKDKIALIIDDGLATGVTARVAAMMAKNQGAQKVIVAVPVASTRTVHELNLLGIEVISLHSTNDFLAVGYFYKIFNQVEDAEVITTLKNTKKWFTSGPEVR